MSYLIRDVLQGLPVEHMEELPAPPYTGPLLDNRRKVGLAVYSMRSHTSDEGWQLFKGLSYAGYRLAGYGLPYPETNVVRIMEDNNPGTLFIQDQREWEGLTADRRLPIAARFINVRRVRDNTGVFKLTVLKDSHQKPEYHRNSADSMGCHAWVVYYHPTIVKHLAPYVRERHLIRTYHSIDPSVVPKFTKDKYNRCLISGALGNVYPLRKRLWFKLSHAVCDRLPHPGYKSTGCRTPEYLRTLSSYKVAVCTASVYGYALRKIIEATACGCAVITDLPEDETLPHIDGNLYRVHPDSTPELIEGIVRTLCQHYDEERQRLYAENAINYYNYKHVTARLAEDIEKLKSTY